MIEIGKVYNNKTLFYRRACVKTLDLLKEVVTYDYWDYNTQEKSQFSTSIDVFKRRYIIEKYD